VIEWIAKEDYSNSRRDEWIEWRNMNGYKPKNAGTYIVRATVEGTEDYPPAEAMEEFTIAKKPATIKIENGSAVYTGEEFNIEDIANVTVTGEITEDKGKLEYDLSSKPAKIQKVGSYVLTATVKEDAGEVYKNYDVTVEDGIFDVTEAGEMTDQWQYFNTDGDKDGHCVFDGKRHGVEVKAIADGKELSPSEAKVYYKLTKIPASGEVDYSEELTSPEGGITNKDLAAAYHAGKYVIWWYIDAKDYDDVKGSAIVDVDKAYLNVEAEDNTITYGTSIKYKNWRDAEAQGFVSFKVTETEKLDSNELPLIEEAVEGLNEFKLTMVKQNGDEYVGELSDVGSYTITPSELKSDDYIITYSSAMLTIEPKPVTFSWNHNNDYEFTYDGKEHGIEAEINADDLVTTDKQEGKVEIVYEDNNKFPSKAKDVKREEGKDGDWSVGSYTAKVMKLKGPRAHNYMIDWEDTEQTFQSDYKIVPVDLYLTPNDVTIFFGDKAVDNGYKASGLVNDEKAEDVLLGLPAEYEFGGYARGSDAGVYDISITNVDDPNTTEKLHAQNYTVKTLVNKEGLTVEQRPVTLKWSPVNKFEYDGKYHEVKVVGADNDYAGDSVYNPEPTYTDNKMVNAGEYLAVAQLSEKDAKNYKVLNDSQYYKWQIKKRPATIYAKNKKIDYGKSPANGGYYIDKKPLVKNVENGNKLDSIGKVSYKYNYSKNGKPGNYKITPVVTNLNPNYYIAKTVKGKLTVNYKQKILLAQAKTSGKNGVRLSWNSVSGAKKYVVYFCKCKTAKKTYKFKKVKTLKGKTFRVGNLSKHKCHKFYIVAKDKKGKQIAKSRESHIITTKTEGKLTNAKSLKVKKKKITVARGASVKIKSKLKKQKGKRTLLDQGHVALLRYTSANKAVATVSATGVITGMSKGWCKVYVHSANGMWQEIQVTVK
jgi:hypothetical protein